MMMMRGKARWRREETGIGRCRRRRGSGRRARHPEVHFVTCRNHTLTHTIRHSASGGDRRPRPLQCVCEISLGPKEIVTRRERRRRRRGSHRIQHTAGRPFYICNPPLFLSTHTEPIDDVHTQIHTISSILNKFQECVDYSPHYTLFNNYLWTVVPCTLFFENPAILMGRTRSTHVHSVGESAHYWRHCIARIRR